ncbi:MAG: hypothetical protein ACK4S4_04060 [Pyrinomonadaceae bacterium]
MNRKKSLCFSIAAAVVAAAAFLFGGMSEFSGGQLTTAVSAQNDTYLQRRIDQIEQRFYMLESRLNSVEQQSRFPGTTIGSGSRVDSELSTMRTQLDLLRLQLDDLRLRVGEIECGLAKIDERTLTPAAREQRRRAAADSTEPCRANPNAPVKFSAR